MKNKLKTAVILFAFVGGSFGEIEKCYAVDTDNSITASRDQKQVRFPDEVKPFGVPVPVSEGDALMKILKRNKGNIADADKILEQTQKYQEDTLPRIGFIPFGSSVMVIVPSLSDENSKRSSGKSFLVINIKKEGSLDEFLAKCNDIINDHEANEFLFRLIEDAVKDHPAVEAASDQDYCKTVVDVFAEAVIHQTKNIIQSLKKSYGGLSGTPQDRQKELDKIKKSGGLSIRERAKLFGS